MANPGANHLLAVSLGLAVGSGLALYVGSQFSAGFKLAILVHPVASLVAIGAVIAPLARHARDRAARRSWRSRPTIDGTLTAAAAAAVAVSGAILCGHSLGWWQLPLFAFHRDAVLVMAILGVLHVSTTLGRHPESKPALLRSVMIASTTGCAIALVALAPSRVIERTVVAGGASAPSGPDTSLSPFDSVDMTGCMATGCHASITREHLRSAHAVSHRSRYFRAILARLHDEQPDQSGFCSGCHFPATVDGNPDHDIPGMHCLTCHAVDRIEASKPFGSQLHLRLTSGHLSVLDGLGRAAGGHPSVAGRLSPSSAFWVRAAAPSHRRGFAAAETTSSNDLCLACHALYVPPPEQSRSMPDKCTDCHMRGQADLRLADASATPASNLRHLFAGSNASLFADLGDPEMSNLVQRWLRGLLAFDAQIPYWTFGQYGRAEQRGTWLSMRVEPIQSPSPGAPWPVRVVTVNVGVGHPFPSAPMDLVRVELEGDLRSRTGRAIWRVADGALTLGATTVTDRGERLAGHRLWIPHHDVGSSPIPLGESTSGILEIPLPADPSEFPLRLELRWVYTDLDEAFRRFAQVEDIPPTRFVVAETRADVAFGTARDNE